MSTFDADTFMNSEVQGAMETKYTPPPIGDYNAFIEDVEAAKLGDASGLKIKWKITDEQLKQLMGRDDNYVTQTVFLDFETDGRLAFGTNKNVQLGALRAAVGQNGPEAWSPRNLKGAGPCVLKISHRMGKKGPEDGPYANVDRVTKAA